MTWVVLALAVLALGIVASVLGAWRVTYGVRIGITTACLAGTLCVIGGWEVLSLTDTTRLSVSWALPLGFAELAIDGLSAWFLLVIGLVSIGASIYSWGYFNNAKEHGSVGAYGPLLCTMIGAMVLVVCASDVVLFLIGWELMSLSAFFLVGLRDEDADVRSGAWTYLVATHVGTALGVLPVLSAFVARTGSTSMGGFAGAFGAAGATTCAVLFTLGAIGFGTKAGSMPMHVWLPVAHPVAPSPISALMSGVVIKTGIYGLLRLVSWLPDLPIGCAVGLLIVSLATGVMGILYALGQSQIKRMLAYSSVENIGIIGLAISVALLGRSLQHPVLVALGFGGALLHVLNHALFKGLLFLSAGAVLHDTGTGDMERLGGLARITPLNAFAFLVGSVAICALPPLNGFVSEFAIYMGVLLGVLQLSPSYAAVLASSAAALGLIGGLAMVVFAKTFSVVFLGAQRDPSVSVHSTPTTMSAGMLFLALGCFVAAMASGTLLPAISTALTPFAMDTSAKANTMAASIGLVARILPPIGVLIVVAIGLFIARRWLPSGRPIGEPVATWGCGFAYPKSTMQYTSSSFVRKLVESFRHVIHPTRQMPLIVGSFPSQGRLVTSTTDFLLERIYKPVFRGLARMFERLWPLQRGRVQLYLAYIVTTVLIVFLVETWFAPFLAHDEVGVTHAAVESQVSDVRVESVVRVGSDRDR